MTEYPFPSEDRDAFWSATDITALICSPGYMSPDDWRPITFCAVVLAESGGMPHIVSAPNWDPGAVTHLSVDLGLFQLNSYYNVEVDPFPTLPAISIADCLTPLRSWQQAWALLNVDNDSWGYNMRWWSAYKEGTFVSRLPAALAGMRQYRQMMGLGSDPF